MANPYARRYTQVETTTLPPERLLLLLYEGAIGFLGRAREALAEGRLGPGKTALSKGMAIVAELQNSLDPAAGWDGAQDLSHLYGHMILELTEANLRGDLTRIDRVRELLAGLYGAWAQAIDSVASEPGPGDPAPGDAEPAAPAGPRGPFRTSV